MVPSTKLITIREAANRLGLKESTIRKYILKRQIAYVKPSVRDEPLEGVQAGTRRRGMDQEAEAGLSQGPVTALVLGMSPIPSALGHALHGGRRGRREADLSPQATPATD